MISWTDEDKAIIAHDPDVLGMIRGDNRDDALMAELLRKSSGCPMCNVRRGMRPENRDRRSN